MKALLLTALLLPLLTACASTHRTTASADRFRTFITPADLDRLMREHTLGDDLILIDARSAEAYAKGHLPGAINLPPDALRTAKAKPGEGRSQYLFRDGDPDLGPLDAGRYARVFGDAGVEATDTVVVYGNHAGKGDGSVPVMILDMLGHRGALHFIDGIGVDRYTEAGGTLTTEPTALPASTYAATPREGVVWDRTDVRDHLGDPTVVFYDTRSADEFTGRERRNNPRGGHLPGAVHLDYAALLDSRKNVVSPATLARPARSIPLDRNISVA